MQIQTGSVILEELPDECSAEEPHENTRTTGSRLVKYWLNRIILIEDLDGFCITGTQDLITQSRRITVAPISIQFYVSTSTAPAAGSCLDRNIGRETQAVEDGFELPPPNII